MKNSLLAFLCAAAIGGNVAAYPASTVREDRIWEHYGSYGGTTLFQSRFYGTTELNGKLYHNLIFTKKSYSSNFGFNDMTDALDEEVFLMREENGVIYLVRNADWQDKYGLCETAPQEEMVICDFNCEAGESFHSISALTWIGRYGNYSRGFHENTFHVAATDSIKINGEMCKRLFIDKVTNSIGEEKVFPKEKMPEIVEGLMGVNGGILPVMSALTENYYAGHILGKLTHAYDLDRNIIYEGCQSPLQYLDSSLPKMLVDDYRWEYWLSSADGILNELVSMEFDGEKSQGGKAYRVLRSRREAAWKYGEGVSIDYINREPKIFEKIYLLREEAGKVYLWNDGSYGQSQEEFIVYDFTLDRTFSYTGIESNCYPGCEGDNAHQCSVIPKVFNVNSVMYIGNEDRDEFRKIITFECDNSVEASSNNCLIRQADDAASFNSMLPFTQFVPSSGSKYSRVRLNNVYYKEGGIAFVGENEAVPEDSYVPLIREDRVWEYVYFKPISLWEYSPELWKVKFDGTETINNRTYHVFKPISYIYKKADNTDYEEISEFGEDDYRYLREEHGKVYYIHPRNISDYDWENYNVPPKEEWEETLLYDFRQNDSGRFWMTCSAPFSEIEHTRMLMSIGSTGRMDIDGESCKVLHNMDFNYNMLDYRSNIYCECNNGYCDYIFRFSLVEGIGFDGIGTMTFIPQDITTNGDPSVGLNNVYNADGEIIYKGSDVKISVGVEATTADCVSIRREGDSWLIENFLEVSVYDLQGNLLALKRGDSQDSTFRLSSQDYQQGFYIIKATSGSGFAVKKIRM